MGQSDPEGRGQTVRVTSDELIAFEKDLRELHYLMVDLRTPRGPYWSSPTAEAKAERKAEAERLRLLRLAGRYRRTVDRVIGNESILYAPATLGGRAIGTIWEAALVNLSLPVVASALGQLADRVCTAIGMIEGDPTLLDPPPPRTNPLPHQAVTVTGDSNIVSLAGRDSTQRHIHTGGGQTELRQILGELTEAVRNLDRSVKDRAVALTVAQQVAAAIDAPDRDSDELADHWTWLGRFADGLAAAAAPATLGTLYQQATPLMEPLMRLGSGG